MNGRGKGGGGLFQKWIKKKSFNSGLKKNLTSEHIIAKSHLNNLSLKQQKTEECYSELYGTLSKQDLTKQTLYPLRDGSFILSEKPPIIITPLRSPLYHRSTQSFFKDDKDEENCSPKNHYIHILSPVHNRRLAAASSTSDLLHSGHRRNTLSPSHLHRSNSAKKTQTRPYRMPTSTKKYFGSYPKIKIENVSNDQEN